MKRTTLIIHAGESGKEFMAVLKSIVNQTEKAFDIVFIGEIDSEVADFIKDNNISFEWVATKDKTYPKAMNEALELFLNEFILYIDNRENPVVLKKAALQSCLIAAERNPRAAMFYFDYEIATEQGVKELHLLAHHIGRVRDNQDYGKVFFFRREFLEDAGAFDERLKFKHLYDIRLKLSEKYDLIRIANKYSGSFYQVLADKKEANVFDYLLSGKDVQLEAEEVLTEHLKRINAYLPPNVFMSADVEEEKEAELLASVIIPVGHRPEFIATAIESIQSQSIKDIEAIIVVNGGDEDPTIDVVKKYMKGGEFYDETKPEVRLIVVDINNIGLCLNIGAKNARGKYYVQLDSDDRLKADAVEKIVRKYDSDPDIGMVIGSYEVWEKKDDGSLVRMDDIPVVTHDEWTDDNGRNNLLRINGAGAPRSLPISVIKAMGYFSINDDTFARNYGEDYEMVLKVSEYFKIGRIYDPIYEVVRHSGGTDHAISEEVITRNDEAKDEMRKKAILRRISYNNSQA